MESFVQYLELLLPAPLKKVRKSVNNLVAFCGLAGKLFDDAMASLFYAREQAKLLSCDALMLPEHGRERNIVQLEGESAEAYRIRLAMQFDIAQKAGTTEGITLAIQSLGYRNVQLEAVKHTYPDRWAEFFVWVGDKAESTPVDVQLIYREVSKTKRATTKAVFGLQPVLGTGRLFSHASAGAYITIYPYIAEEVDIENKLSLSATTNAALSITIDPKEV